jgi:SAM-dependent methyltransferase
MSGWDADRHQRQFGFVSAMAGGALELLDASPGEVVLDLGCGTGELAARIAATGARVIGLDSDPAAEILAAVGAALAEAGLPGPASPWYFPTPAQQAALLEGAGFRVARMEYFPRPTPLTDCPDGLADWLEMFGGSLTAEVPPALLPQVLGRVNELAAPRLRRGGGWFADYWRLRFLAIADPPATGPRRVPAGSSSRLE